MKSNFQLGKQANGVLKLQPQSSGSTSNTYTRATTTAGFNSLTGSVTHKRQRSRLEGGTNVTNTRVTQSRL